MKQLLLMVVLAALVGWAVCIFVAVGDLKDSALPTRLVAILAVRTIRVFIALHQRGD